MAAILSRGDELARTDVVRDDCVRSSFLLDNMSQNPKRLDYKKGYSENLVQFYSAINNHISKK